MSRTILYYPDIQIPTSGTWIRKALLYWDRLGAIVPQSYDHRMDAAMLKRYSPEIECLHKDGIFKPFNPEMVVGNEETRRVFRSELKEALFPRPASKGNAKSKPQRCDVPIYRDKVTGEIFRDLERQGLAVKDHQDDDLYLFERTVANIYMALLAKHLAIACPESTIPGSDSAAETEIMFGVTKARVPKNLVLSAEFSDLIPTPSADVPLRRILKFRGKYQAALLSFRSAIDQLESELRQCTEGRELKAKVQSHKDKIAAETTNLQKALRANSIGSWLGSLEAFFKPSSPAILTAGYALASKTGSVASVPVDLLAIGAAGAGAIGVGMHWFNKVQERRATLEKSPFAYLLLAKKKLG